MRVFVVHGRNHKVRNGVIDWLRSHGVEVLEWDGAINETGQASPFTWDAVRQGLKNADKVIVLFTPDEIVALHPDLSQLGDPELQSRGQARPNVYLEAGYAMGLDEDRVLLVEMGEQSIATDLSGHNRVRLDPSVAAQKSLLTRLGVDFDETSLKSQEELLALPTFSLPVGLPDRTQHVTSSSEIVQGVAPDKRKGAFAFYEVFPQGSDDRRIYTEDRRHEDQSVVTWAISRSRIRAVRGTRSSRDIVPLDFSYVLNGVKHEKTLELID